MLPSAVAAPPSLYIARLPPLYSHRMKLLRHRLKEAASPYLSQLQQLTTPQLLQFPDLRLVQYDAGRGEPFSIFFSFFPLLAGLCRTWNQANVLWEGFTLSYFPKFRQAGSPGGLASEVEVGRTPGADLVPDDPHARHLGALLEFPFLHLRED